MGHIGISRQSDWKRFRKDPSVELEKSKRILDAFREIDQHVK